MEHADLTAPKPLSTVVAAIAVAVIISAGCMNTGGRPGSIISTGPDGLRTFGVFREVNGTVVLCPAFAAVNPVTGTLRGQAGGEPEPLWLEADDGRRLSVVWPGGFTLRFEPDAVLYNEHMIAVSRAGETVVLKQSPAEEHAGTFEDPHFASGLVFGGCYPLQP